MARIPAGSFLMGSPAGVGLEDEHPQRKIELSTFDIDVTEVTVAAYARCVAEGACTEARCTKTDETPSSLPDRPQSCVSWSQAGAHCRWAGKRLPTEAEWEKAARGVDGRIYPWGNVAATCAHTSFSGCEGPHAVASKAAGKSPFGVHDMAGNVYEWVADWHHPDYYAIAPERDPAGPWSGDKKVVRGGAFNYAAEELTSAGRTFDTPDKAFPQLGFRCARSPDVAAPPAN